MHDRIIDTVDKEELRSLIANALEISTEEVSDDADLTAELGTNSLITIAIAGHIKERYDVMIEDAVLGRIGSLNQLTNIVTTMLKAKS